MLLCVTLFPLTTKKKVQKLSLSSEMAFLDSSSNMEEFNLCIFLMVTHTHMRWLFNKNNYVFSCQRAEFKFLVLRVLYIKKMKSSENAVKNARLLSYITKIYEIGFRDDLRLRM